MQPLFIQGQAIRAVDKIARIGCDFLAFLTKQLARAKRQPFDAGKERAKLKAEV